MHGLTSARTQPVAFRPRTRNVFIVLSAILAGSGSAQENTVPAAELTPTAAISGSGDEVFLTHVHIARVSPAGRVLVYDGGELALLEFDLDGRFVRRLGREGPGPGEFLRIDRVGVLGDSVWVLDWRQRRVTWFEAGELVGTQSVGDSALYNAPVMLIDRDRLLSWQGFLPDPHGRTVGVQTWSGAILDTIARLPERTPTMVDVQGSRHFRRVRNVLSDVPLSDYSVSGKAAVFVDRPRPGGEGRTEVRVIRYFRDGTSERVLRFPVHPLARVEEEKLDRWLKAVYEQYGRRFGLSRLEIRDAHLDAIGRPEYALPVYNAQVEDNGRVWLAVEATNRGMRWIRLDSELRVAGAVLVPAGITVQDINRGLLVAVAKDEWDVPHIRIYSVEGIPHGPLSP